MNEAELCYLPATDLARRIARKDLSPVEVVDGFLARIERINPRLNAYCTVTGDEARQAAREAEATLMRGDRLGPLHGVPVSIKDVVITKGVRTTRGSRLYQDFVPDEDAPLVTRLKTAGAIVLGKTNTPELGWKGVTDNLVFGPTRNPWNLERTPGGSSGGASAAVAAGLGPIAIGTDGGGSIRIPAAFSGIYGLKPSFGRVPIYPPSALEQISHAGPMTYYVRDAALTLQVIAGPDERDRNTLPASEVDYLRACDGDLAGLKVAWSPDLGYAPVEPAVRTAAELAAQRFSELGCTLEQVDLDWGDCEPTWSYFFYGNLTAYFSPDWAEKRPLLDPGLAEMIDQWRATSMTDYVQALFERAAYWERVRPLFERYDLLLTPTMPLGAFEVSRNTPDEIAGHPVRGLSWSPFTYPFNLTGQPAASLPGGVTPEGLPIGLQVVGRRFADETVLRASAAFEAAAPWQHHRPNL